MKDVSTRAIGANLSDETIALHFGEENRPLAKNSYV